MSFYYDWINFHINGINPGTTSEPNKTTTSVVGKTTTRESDKITTIEPGRTTTSEPSKATTTTSCNGICPVDNQGAANMIDTNLFLGLIFHLFLMFVLLR